VNDLEGDVIDTISHQVRDEYHEEIGRDAGLGDCPIDKKRGVDEIDDDY